MRDSMQPSGQTSQASNDSDHAASMSPIENGTSKAMREDTEPLDDQGTTQEDALDLLETLHEGVFDSNNEKLALALGRTTEDVEAWLNGTQSIDTDVLLKARALVMERGDSSIEAE